MKASIDASPTSAWLMHGLLITSDSCCHLSVMFSASFIFPFPNTDESVKSRPCVDKEQVLFDVFTFRIGVLDTPSFILS